MRPVKGDSFRVNLGVRVRIAHGVDDTDVPIDLDISQQDVDFLRNLCPLTWSETLLLRPIVGIAHEVIQCLEGVMRWVFSFDRLEVAEGPPPRRGGAVRIIWFGILGWRGESYSVLRDLARLVLDAATRTPGRRA